MSLRGRLSCFAILCFVAAAAWGQRQNADFAQGRLFAPQVILEHREALSLQAEQSREIRDIVSEFQGKVSALRWDMAGFVDELSSLLDSGPVDEDAVTAHAEALMALENEVRLEQLKMLVRIRNVLTAEQVTYLKSLSED